VQTIWGLLFLGLFLTPGGWAASVQPIATDELLKNPGIGWMTMFKPAVKDRNLPADIPSSVYYVRLNWETIHKGPDVYDWRPIDQAIEDALAGGQQIILRLMPVWAHASSPTWMQRDGAHGYLCNLNGPKWIADLDDPRVQNWVGLLLQAMGQRYDRNPGVFGVEISFLGVYGEGHFNECPHVPMPQPGTQEWLVNEHYRSFPTVPIMGPIDARAGKVVTRYMYAKAGRTRGAGIFMDAWGDYQQYQHMQEKYPQWLTVIHGGGEIDAWKRGPIKLEPSGTLNQWPQHISESLAWAEKMHASLIGNKDARFPDEYKSQIMGALRKLGYRLVLRRIDHPDSLAPGATAAFSMQIENIGVAPPYRDYYISLRLKSAFHETEFVSGSSVKFWAPGSHTATLRVPLDANVPEGQYEVALAFVDPLTRRPSIQMPVPGRDASGWHIVSSVSVKAN
jgi:hypothetical protein